MSLQKKINHLIPTKSVKASVKISSDKDAACSIHFSCVNGMTYKEDLQQGHTYTDMLSIINNAGQHFSKNMANA